LGEGSAVLRRILYAIVDAPSHEAMVAIAGTVGQTGALSKYETVVLLTPAQIDAAANMKVNYTPPGHPSESPPSHQEPSPQ
jgi:hypothetical protein